MRYLLLVCLLISLRSAHAQAIVAGPIAGAVTEGSASILIATDIAAQCVLEISHDRDFATTIASLDSSTSAENYFFKIFRLTSLSPHTEYFVRASLNGVLTGHSLSFRTLPAPGLDTSFTITFGSCQMQDKATRPSSVFRRMREDKSTMLFHLGDWSYPDLSIGPAFTGSDSLLAASYRLRYDSRHGIDTLLRSTPVDYVYDDHDFGGSNTDRTHPDRVRSINAYTRFFPHYTLPESGQGLWHSVVIGNAEVFMLDLRSQRSPNNEAVTQNGGVYAWAPPPGHTILGSEQKAWLLNGLKSSTARWKVIMSPVTWNPSMAQLIPLGVAYANFTKNPARLLQSADTWIGFPEDQDSIIAFAQRGIANIIVCSGDMHTGMMDDGRNSIFPEIVSANFETQNSNIYGELDSLGFAKNMWNRGGQIRDSLNTYGRLTVLTEPRHALRMELVDERGIVIATHTVQDASISAIALVDTSSVKFERISQERMRVIHAGITTGGIAIQDVLGRTLAFVALGNESTVVELDRLPSGTYRCLLASEGRGQSYSRSHASATISIVR